MVTKELVKKVASIARIELSEEEVNKFTKEFTAVIDWFNELGEVDTKGVKPSYHPLKTENVFREDEVKECLSQEESLINTNHKEKGFFKGPKAV